MEFAPGVDKVRGDAEFPGEGTGVFADEGFSGFVVVAADESRGCPLVSLPFLACLQP